MAWDPLQYARFAGERSRPFFDLISQVSAEQPHSVVDVGCGSGALTLTLGQRWPDAHVRGIDSSAEMVARAPRDGGVDFAVAAAETFDATGVDVLVSNAALQWVPLHRQLLAAWAGQLNAGGWLAFQVPSNFAAPSHVLMRELADSPRWRDRLAGVLRGTDSVEMPEAYLSLLVQAGLSVQVWQTEYLHVLPGENPVLEWLRGTGLRPVLAALTPEEGEQFSAEFGERLRAAYPRREFGTVFPFRRTFAVGHKPAAAS